MSGETNLEKILKNLDPYIVKESFIFMTSDAEPTNLFKTLNPIATFMEDEGLTLVITQHCADKNDIKYDSVFKCISLGVHSSLESYGLISTISNELTKSNISTNVFSGYFHDHIFVESNKVNKALKVISSISIF